jgi:hypothetical protein
MLTLEQIAEGRRRLAEYDTSTDGRVTRARDAWLIEHAEALLDAAERVAHQEAYANGPDGYDSPELADLIARGKLTSRNTYAEALAEAREARASARLDGETHVIEDDATFARNELAAGEWLVADKFGKLTILDRFKAERRAAELEAECLTEFHMRPCMARGSHSVNPHAFGPEHVEAWYRSRGVVVQAETGPDPGRLNIKPLRMVR